MNNRITNRIFKWRMYMSWLCLMICMMFIIVSYILESFFMSRPIIDNNMINQAAVNSHVCVEVVEIVGVVETKDQYFYTFSYGESNDVLGVYVTKDSDLYANLKKITYITDEKIVLDGYLKDLPMDLYQNLIQVDSNSLAPTKYVKLIDWKWEKFEFIMAVLTLVFSTVLLVTYEIIVRCKSAHA